MLLSTVLCGAVAGWLALGIQRHGEAQARVVAMERQYRDRMEDTCQALRQSLAQHPDERLQWKLVSTIRRLYLLAFWRFREEAGLVDGEVNDRPLRREWAAGEGHSRLSEILERATLLEDCARDARIRAGARVFTRWTLGELGSEVEADQELHGPQSGTAEFLTVPLAPADGALPAASRSDRSAVR